MGIKIAHMSDLHYAGETLKEVDHCFGYAVDQAIAGNVDVAIITGDSTDHRLDAHAPAFIALMRQIKRLADHCPVLMLQGTFSHEPPGMLDIFEMIGGRYPIAVASRISQFVLDGALWRQSTGAALNQDEIDTAFAGTPRLVVTAVPTVNKAVLASHIGVENAAHELGNALRDVIASFGPVNAGLKRAGVPSMLLSHGTVNGCETEHGVPMMGLDHEFTIGVLFLAETDAVALGHIHKHQSWRNEAGQLAAYAGSIGRLHYGEVGDKVYLTWALKAGQAHFETTVLPARVLVDIDFSGPPDMGILTARAATCTDAFVRIRYSVDKEYKDSVDRAGIEGLFVGAAGLKIEGRVLPPQRARAEGILGDKSLAAKIERWGEATSTEVGDVLDRAGMLEALSAEEIAVAFAEQLERMPVPASVGAGQADVVGKLRALLAA